MHLIFSADSSTNNITCVHCKDSDQNAHLPSLCARFRIYRIGDQIYIVEVGVVLLILHKSQVFLNITNDKEIILTQRSEPPKKPLNPPLSLISFDCVYNGCKGPNLSVLRTHCLHRASSGNT